MELLTRLLFTKSKYAEQAERQLTKEAPQGATVVLHQVHYGIKKDRRILSVVTLQSTEEIEKWCKSKPWEKLTGVQQVLSNETEKRNVHC